jgi:hypothetical protein
MRFSAIAAAFMATAALVGANNLADFKKSLKKGHYPRDTMMNPDPKYIEKRTDREDKFLNKNSASKSHIKNHCASG